MSQITADNTFSGTAIVETLTDDAGGVISPSSGNITLAGGNNITTSGAGNTITIDVTDTTDHAVQVGNATGSLTSLGLGLTAQVLKGNTGADPSWGAVDLTTDVSSILPVGSGGTGYSGAWIPDGLTVTKVASGIDHTVVLLSDGSVWSAGDNSNGELGTGDTTAHLVFVPAIGEGRSGVDDIGVGTSFTLILKSGAVFGVGSNFYGQLGTGSTAVTVKEWTAATGEGASGVNSIACGTTHSAIIKSGAVFAAGRGDTGQLGDNTVTNRNIFTAMVGHGASGVTSICAGEAFTVVTKTGVGYGTGLNNYGQLGVGDWVQKDQLTAMTGQGTAGITQVICGWYHTIVHKSGVGYGTGRNVNGQLGTTGGGDKNTLTAMTGFGTAGISNIYAGGRHTVIEKSGVCYACGRNTYGEICDGTTTQRTSLVVMSAPGDAGVTTVGCGENTTHASKSGVLYNAGLNSSGQLGLGSDDDKYVLTPIGLTDHGVLIGNATDPIQAILPGATGELLIGAAGADPAFGTSADGDFTFATATAGITRELTVSNSDNTDVTSGARITLSTGGASGGDPFITHTITGAASFSTGIDNSDSDKYKISASTALGTTDVMTVYTTGEITMPLQSAFSATLGTADSNVTGNGATYTLGGGNALTEIFDQNADFNTNGTFTAPVTGRYFLSSVMRVSGITNAMTAGELRLVTTGRTYTGSYINPYAAGYVGAYYVFSVAAFADMAVGDTATVQLIISNGADDTADIDGPGYAYFSGYLVC